MAALQLVGKGLTADVYAWEGGRVLKLFHSDFPREWVAYEAKLSGLAFGAGLAAPATDGLLDLDGKTGILYERIDGLSMLQLVSAQPWLIFRLARQFVEMQLTMHHTLGTGFPSQREHLERDIRSAPKLDATAKDRLIELLHDLPDGEVICHGDYHPDNLILSPRGPVVIDWMNAVRGNPLADVARTSLMFSSPFLPPGIKGIQKRLISLGRSTLHKYYLRQYLKHELVSWQQIEAWMPVIAAARLGERIPGEETWLLEIISRALSG
jgi:hypothetical protein